MSRLLSLLGSLLIVVTTLLPTAASATDTNNSGHRRRAQLVHRLDRLDLPLNLPVTDALTQAKIDDYLDRGGRSTERMLGRADVYFPIFDFYLRKHDLPASLKYLAVAESMLVPGAVSGASAAGLWQLMPATAREMGLRVDAQVDERLDIHRSTEAAVLMLKRLHEEFNDWHLVLAAYNCGAGRVRGAIRTAGADNYEAVQKLLPEETRRYVSAYLAAAYAVNYYEDHGLSPREIQGTGSIRIYRATNLAQLARETGVRFSTLVRMNPVFQRPYIPSSDEGYRLWVPYGYKAAVQQYLWGRDNQVELPEDENLEDARAVAERMDYDIDLLLFGVKGTALHYAVACPSVLLARERMLLTYYAGYRTFASL